MNADTLSDIPVAFESEGENSETLGECSTPEVSAGEGHGPTKRKRAREREMQRRLEENRKRKRQRKLARGNVCRGCSVCLTQ
jgi:hypothetical protein